MVGIVVSMRRQTRHHARVRLGSASCQPFIIRSRGSRRPSTTRPSRALSIDDREPCIDTQRFVEGRVPIQSLQQGLGGKASDHRPSMRTVDKDGWTWAAVLRSPKPITATC